MPETQYAVGYGSQLYYSTNGSSYTKIGQTRDLNTPQPEVGDINLTNNDSPDNTKEYAPGMIEPGEIDFEVVYTKAQTATLYGLFGNGVTYYFREVLTDGGTWNSRGYVKKFGIETKTEDEANMTTMSVKLTQKPQFSLTSGSGS